MCMHVELYVPDALRCYCIPVHWEEVERCTCTCTKATGTVERGEESAKIRNWIVCGIIPDMQYWLLVRIPFCLSPFLFIWLDFCIEFLSAICLSIRSFVTCAPWLYIFFRLHNFDASFTYTYRVDFPSLSFALSPVFFSSRLLYIHANCTSTFSSLKFFHSVLNTWYLLRISYSYDGIRFFLVVIQ